MRDRLQSWVDRLVYGDRRDPLSAIRRVGASVSAASADPLPAVVGSVADAVRASFVAITGADGTVLAAAGTQRSGARMAYPLTVAGERVGELVICPARGEPAVPAADARLIAALIAPVAAIVHAGQLTRRLASAHERTLAAAGRERSRIRRDLHDGLGPSLSGVSLGLEAAQAPLPDDTQTAATLTARSAMIVDVRVAEPMPGLPERVEIVAFRIAEEAMANVLRHARASRCEVRLDVDDALVVSISDNGVGLPAQTRTDGIGLTSMRQRASDLGGRCTVGPAVPSGVIVHARLPLEVTT